MSLFCKPDGEAKRMIEEGVAEMEMAIERQRVEDPLGFAHGKEVKMWKRNIPTARSLAKLNVRAVAFRVPVEGDYFINISNLVINDCSCVGRSFGGRRLILGKK